MITLRVEAFDAALRPTAWATKAAGLKHTETLHEVGITDLDLPSSSQISDALVQPGACYRVSANGRYISSGVVDGWEEAKKTNVTKFRGETHNRLFRDVLAWNVPEYGSQLHTKSAVREAQVYQGDTQDVILRILMDNLYARLGVQYSTHQGGGASQPNQTIVARFQPIQELIQPVMRACPTLRIHMIHSVTTGGLQLRVDATTLWPVPISLQSRTVADYKIVANNESATRVIVGGQGEKLDKDFWGPIISTDPDTQDRYQPVEIYLEHNQEDADLTFWDAAQKALAGGRAAMSVQLQGISTTPFSPYAVGDRVHVKVGPSTTVLEQVTKMVTEFTPDKGFRQTPTIGEGFDNPDADLRKALRDLTLQLKRLQRR